MPIPTTRCLAWFLCALLAARASHAQSPLPDAPARPRVGLVLSGGGARGAAHIGVLKALDRLHIPVDVIVGTSMGAVVGGLYATGLTGVQVEQAVTSVDWQDAFRDRPPRSALDFRRKLEDRQFLVDLPIGLQGKRLAIPKGLIQGEKLTQTLRALTLPVAGIDKFDELPTRFRAVATNLERGTPVVLSEGDLTTALRASMSAPGVFAPVEYRGQLLVDGGLVDNLPIDVARAMGVDVLIVVDADLPLQGRKQLASIAGITNQMITILMRQGTTRQLATLAPTDVLISPQLGGFTSFDFANSRRIVAAGERAAEQVHERLAALAVTEPAFEAYQAARRARRAALPRLDFISNDELSAFYRREIHDVFGDLAGQPLSPEQIDGRINKLYGRGDLELLDYHLVPAPAAAGAPAPGASAAPASGVGAEFIARRNSWGPDYLRFGLQLEDNFEGDTQFNAAARLDMKELNSLGAESVWDLQVGSSPLAGTELYLPLSNVYRFFFAPHAQVQAHDVAQIENERQVGNFRVRSADYGIDFGSEIQHWGEWRIGVADSTGRAHVDVGDYTVPSSSFDVKQLFGRLSIDTLDRANFPHSGQALTSQVQVEQGGGGERGTDTWTLDWRAIHSWARNSLEVWASYGNTFGGSTANVRSFFPLGGFLSLSGLPSNSLAGPQLAIGRLIYLHKIGNGGEGVLDVPGYIGASLERGNIWSDRDAISFRSARSDYSVFFGADTYLGPAYLALGYDERGSTAIYLYLGRGL